MLTLFGITKKIIKNMKNIQYQYNNDDHSLTVINTENQNSTLITAVSNFSFCPEAKKLLIIRDAASYNKVSLYNLDTLKEEINNQFHSAVNSAFDSYSKSITINLFAQIEKDVYLILSNNDKIITCVVPNETTRDVECFVLPISSRAINLKNAKFDITGGKQGMLYSFTKNNPSSSSLVLFNGVFENNNEKISRSSIAISDSSAQDFIIKTENGVTRYFSAGIVNGEIKTKEWRVDASREVASVINVKTIDTKQQLSPDCSISLKYTEEDANNLQILIYDTNGNLLEEIPNFTNKFNQQTTTRTLPTIAEENTVETSQEYSALPKESTTNSDTTERMSSKQGITTHTTEEATVETSQEYSALPKESTTNSDTTERMSSKQGITTHTTEEATVETSQEYSALPKESTTNSDTTEKMSSKQGIATHTTEENTTTAKQVTQKNQENTNTSIEKTNPEERTISNTTTSQSHKTEPHTHKKSKQVTEKTTKQFVNRKSTSKQKPPTTKNTQHNTNKSTLIFTNPFNTKTTIPNYQNTTLISNPNATLSISGNETSGAMSVGAVSGISLISAILPLIGILALIHKFLFKKKAKNNKKEIKTESTTELMNLEDTSTTIQMNEIRDADSLKTANDSGSEMLQEDEEDIFSKKPKKRTTVYEPKITKQKRKQSKEFSVV